MLMDKERPRRRFATKIEQKGATDRPEDFPILRAAPEPDAPHEHNTAVPTDA
jgi:hypothetical protein